MTSTRFAPPAGTRVAETASTHTLQDSLSIYSSAPGASSCTLLSPLLRLAVTSPGRSTPSHDKYRLRSWDDLRGFPLPSASTSLTLLPVESSESPSQAIRSRSQLEQYFHAGGKQRDDWRIGVEYEKPVVDAATGESVSYDGDRGIGRLLEAMLKRSCRWEGVYEVGNLIALRDGKSSITLEPGGQLEMSGQQCDSLHCVDEELGRHVEEILAVGADLGLTFLALGAVPKTGLERIPWMPKERYRFMRRIMQTTGRMGLRMMLQTATVQSNFDYMDEADARRKLRVATAISPLLVAISANSPIIEGRSTNYRSYRAHIWSDTDAARCGFLPFVLDTENIFAAYVDYALEVPMYFLQRGESLIDVGGISFGTFVRNGYQDHRATMDDWNLHLTTLFPEARLKTYIEVRAADSQPRRLMLGTPAIMKGILYDDDCLDAAWDELKRWPLGELPALHEQAARQALQARVGRHTMRDYALELSEIARRGLQRQSYCNNRGQDESVYLEALRAEIEAGTCPADHLIRHWEGRWAGDIDQLVAYAAYAD